MRKNKARRGGFRRSRAAAPFLLAASLLALASCGYMLVGTGSLPANIKRIQIPLFVNQTGRYTLDLKLTEAVIDEFVSRGQVQITTEESKADAVLLGIIRTFRVNPVAFSDQATADRYDIMVVAEITLKETATGRIIFTNPSYVFKTDYQVPEGEDFESSESEAIDTLAQLFARGLIIAILEGF